MPANPLSLCDMPDIPLEKIVRNLDLIDRFILRKVCKSMRSIVDSSFSHVETIEFSCATGKSEVTVDKTPKLIYSKGKIECENRKIACQKMKYPLKGAVKDLKIVLKNPKIRLETLKIEATNINFNKFFPKIFQQNQLLHVKSVEFRTTTLDQEMPIVSNLHPGTLKKIEWKLEDLLGWMDSFETVLANYKRRFETFFQLAQCQKAESLEVKFYALPNFFPVESLKHCKRLSLLLSGPVETGIFVKIKDTVLASPKIDMFLLTVTQEFDVDFVRTLFEGYTVEDPNLPNRLRFPIKKSKKYFQVDIEEMSIRFERKK